MAKPLSFGKIPYPLAKSLSFGKIPFPLAKPLSFGKISFPLAKATKRFPQQSFYVTVGVIVSLIKKCK
jgi:hypothetical protein